MIAPRQASIVRRLTWLLFFGQSLGSAAFIASSTVGTLVGAQLSGGAWLSGLPGAIYLGGSALAAYPAARLMHRAGRRPGLALGFAVGMAGALLSGSSVLLHSFVVFLLGFALMGAARGFTDLGRYAAAEMHPEDERGRAISLVVLGGTFGAVLGPALVDPTGRLAQTLGADALAGPWFASAALFLLGVVLIGLFLRPDPRDLGRQISVEAPTKESVDRPRVRLWHKLLGDGHARTALAALVLGQLVMVMLMSMTSLHMQGHRHTLSDISLVIALHTLGMFGPSVLSGRLADRWGRAHVIVVGALLLVVACLLAPIAHDRRLASLMPELHLAGAWFGPAIHITQETFAMMLALLLLGLGWNFCYVAGGALLTDTLTLAERSSGQGSVDVLINLASAFGSLGSGVLFALLGYPLIAGIGIGITFVPLLLAGGLLLGGRARYVTAGD